MTITLLTGHNVEVLGNLPAASVDCVVTSPPYWSLRRYGCPPVKWGDGWVGELGTEPTPTAFVAHLVEVFDAVRRVLKPTGTLWVVIGDTYGTPSGPQSPTGLDGRLRAGHQHPGVVDRARNAGVPSKSLVGIPWRFAFAMMDAGWLLRQDVIWAKTNPMPESVTDRCTRAHEYCFLFSLGPRYFWDASAMQETGVLHEGTRIARHNKWLQVGSVNGNKPHLGRLSHGATSGFRNRRSVWSVAVASLRNEAHFATYPPELIRPMVRASCPVGGVVLDPFGGAGTTAIVASQESRDCISIEAVTANVEISRRRLAKVNALPSDSVGEVSTFGVG